jgi:hypothetical protein
MSPLNYQFLEILLEQVRKGQYDPWPKTATLVRIHLGLQDDVMSLVISYRVRVAYRPTLAVFVAHEHLAIVANCPPDTHSFH